MGTFSVANLSGPSDLFSTGDPYFIGSGSGYTPALGGQTGSNIVGDFGSPIGGAVKQAGGWGDYTTPDGRPGIRITPSSPQLGASTAPVQAPSSGGDLSSGSSFASGWIGRIIVGLLGLLFVGMGLAQLRGRD